MERNTKKKKETKEQANNEKGRKENVKQRNKEKIIN
jgi:hypothetical protein